ncbi:MAG: HEPN domain-containing protein [Magnetococcales bacterium]|nr:HEPN domain-containing protein [Magnetococcales bacterium]
MARKDLRSAKILAEAVDPESEAVGFHLQQAVEKSLKAWLNWCQVISPKTHDLRLLLSALEKAGEDVSPFLFLEELNPFAVQFRYTLYDDEPFTWSELQEQVNELVTHVETMTGLLVGKSP